MHRITGEVGELTFETLLSQQTGKNKSRYYYDRYLVTDRAPSTGEL